MAIAIPEGGFLAFWGIVARVAGVMALAPVVGAPFVPAILRICLTLAVALGLWGHVPVAEPPEDVLGYSAWMLSESATGLAIGLMSRMAFAAVQTFGGILDLDLGFGAAGLLNPGSDQPTPLLATFMNLLATVAYLIFNAHYVLLMAVAASFRAIPEGTFAAADFAMPLADAFAQAFLAAVQLAVPVLAASFLVTIALAAFSKAVPQMNVFFVGLPVKMVVGVGGLALLLPIYLTMMRAIFPADAATLLLGPGGGS